MHNLNPALNHTEDLSCYGLLQRRDIQAFLLYLSAVRLREVHKPEHQAAFQGDQDMEPRSL